MIKWLTKISQSKPMPIPFEDTAPWDYKHDDSPGARIIDQNMTRDTAKSEERRNPEMAYLGHGHQGLAYDLGNKVLKYTVDRYEVERANDLMQTPLPCTVKVLNVYKVQKKPPYVWAILLEKVRPLDQYEADVVDYMYDEFRDTGKTNWYPEFQNYEYTFTAYNHMLECLSQDFSTYEARSDNVGWSNGRMVLLDIGPHPAEVLDSLQQLGEA